MSNYEASRAAHILRHGDKLNDRVRDQLVDDLDALPADEIERTACEAVEDARILLSSLDLEPESRTKHATNAAWSLLDDATEKIAQEREEQAEERTQLQQEVYDAQNVATQAQLEAQEARHEAEVQKHLATERRELTVAWNDYTYALATGANPVNPRPQRGAFTEGCRYLVRVNPRGTLAVAVRGPNDTDGNATWLTDADKEHRQPVEADLTVLAYLRTAEEVAKRRREEAEDYEDCEGDTPPMDWATVQIIVLGDLDNTIEDHGNGVLDDEELDERLDSIHYVLQGAEYVPPAVAEEAGRLVMQHTRRNYTDTELQAGMRNLRLLALSDGEIDRAEEER